MYKLYVCHLSRQLSEAGLVDSSGSTAWHSGTEEAVVCAEIYLVSRTLRTSENIWEHPPQVSTSLTLCSEVGWKLDMLDFSTSGNYGGLSMTSFHLRASTVGFPRESKISRAFSITILRQTIVWAHCGSSGFHKVVPQKTWQNLVKKSLALKGHLKLLEPKTKAAEGFAMLLLSRSRT